MKIILLFLFLILSFNTFSQQSGNLSLDSLKRVEAERQNILRQAGGELIRYSGNWYTGSILTISGGLITMTGFEMYRNAINNNPDPSKPADNLGQIIAGFGGLVSLTGIIVVFTSISHVGKAGRLMQKSSSVTLIPDRQFPGLGLCYRF